MSDFNFPKLSEKNWKDDFKKPENTNQSDPWTEEAVLKVAKKIIVKNWDRFKFLGWL